VTKDVLPPVDRDLVLSLSGGGYRATLFHLGVIAYLHAAGHMGRIKWIASVSGGSVLAGHLGLNWDAWSGDPAAFRKMVADVCRLIQSDTRGRVLRRTPSTLVASMLQWRRCTRTTTLASQLDTLFAKKRLGDMIASPRIDIVATNLSTGLLVVFNDGGAEFEAEDCANHHACANLNVSFAVAASAAFPAFFPPVHVTADTMNAAPQDFLPKRQALTDGGVFDNLGVRHIRKRFERNEAPDLKDPVVVVSDAGGEFNWSLSRFSGLFSTAVRASDILYSRVRFLEVEALSELGLNGIASDDIIQLRINDRSTFAGDVPEEVRKLIPRVRTDLDYFSNLECRAIIARGFIVAQANLRHLADAHAPVMPPFDPFPDDKVAIDSPELFAALKQSRVRRWRILSAKDVWGSLQIGAGVLFLAVIAMVILPLLSVKGFEMWSKGAAPIRDLTIKEFMDDGLLAAACKRAQKNVYIVGLTDRTIRSKHFDTLATVTTRGNVKLVNMVYVPSGEPADAVDSYLDIQYRYRPLSGNLRDGLDAMWRSQSTELANSGYSTGVHVDNRNYELWFYSAYPEGWLIVIDFDHEELDALEVYWFPYVLASNNMDRPGVATDDRSRQRKVLLEWLDSLIRDSQKAHRATVGEIEAWRNVIIERLPSYAKSQREP